MGVALGAKVADNHRAEAVAEEVDPVFSPVRGATGFCVSDRAVRHGLDHGRHQRTPLPFRTPCPADGVRPAQQLLVARSAVQVLELDAWRRGEGGGDRLTVETIAIGEPGVEYEAGHPLGGTQLDDGAQADVACRLIVAPGVRRDHHVGL